MTYLLSLLAGVLTALSPCVLPALPLIVGSAVQQHKAGPLSVALGMIFSFTFLGLVFAVGGVAIPFEQEAFRMLGAIVLVIFGLTLLFEKLQGMSSQMLLPISNMANSYMIRRGFKGLFGQFNLGILLGLVWSPCVGPTLGSAIGMAAQKETLFQSALMMFLFGVGSAIPLIALAYGSRRIFMANRDRLMKFAKIGKPLFGLALAMMGIAIIFGLDKAIESFLLKAMPSVWIDLVTKF